MCVEQGAGYSSIVSEFHSHLLVLLYRGAGSLQTTFPRPPASWLPSELYHWETLGGDWKVRGRKELILKKNLFFFAEVFGHGSSNGSG